MRQRCRSALSRHWSSRSRLPVKDFRPGVHLPFQYPQAMPVFSDELRNFALGIVQVPEQANAGHAGGHAGGFAPLLHEFDAEAALLDVPLLFDDAAIIGTGGDAALAAEGPF